MSFVVKLADIILDVKRNVKASLGVIMPLLHEYEHQAFFSTEFIQ